MKLIVILLNLVCFSFLQAQNKNVHNQKYDSIYFEIDETQNEIGLRSKIKSAIHFVNKKGKIFSTVGLGKGKILWNNFDIEVVGGNFQKGVVNVSKNPSTILENRIKIVCKFSKTGEIFLEHDIPLNYLGKYEANYAGREGKIGSVRRNGRNGSNGNSSSSGSGSNGGNGGNGNDGKDGFDGENAPNLKISISEKLLEGNKEKLINFFVLNLESNKIDTFIINANNGFLAISTEGGNGGKGGDGGHGGHGGAGGSGSVGGRQVVNGSLVVTPSGSGGDGGDGGTGGSGGDGGKGGSGGDILVEGSKEVLKYLNLVKFETSAGVAGLSGDRGLEGKNGLGGTGGRGMGQRGNPGFAGMKGQNGFAGEKSGVVTIKEI